METVVRKRWLFGMQLLGFLILDQIPLMMVSVVQFSTENFWFRFVSGLVAVGLGAYFVYLFVAFLKKKKLITWTFLGIKETLPVVLLGLVIIFCVGIFGDFLLPCAAKFLTQVETYATFPFYRSLAYLTREILAAMADELEEGE